MHEKKSIETVKTRKLQRQFSLITLNNRLLLLLLRSYISVKKKKENEKKDVFRCEREYKRELTIIYKLFFLLRDNIKMFHPCYAYKYLYF